MKPSSWPSYKVLLSFDHADESPGHPAGVQSGSVGLCESSGLGCSASNKYVQQYSLMLEVPGPWWELHVLSLNHRARYQGRDCVLFIENILQSLPMLSPQRQGLGLAHHYFGWIEHASGIISFFSSLPGLIRFYMDKNMRRREFLPWSAAGADGPLHLTQC